VLGGGGRACGSLDAPQRLQLRGGRLGVLRGRARLGQLALHGPARAGAGCFNSRSNTSALSQHLECSMMQREGSALVHAAQSILRMMQEEEHDALMHAAKTPVWGLSGNAISADPAFITQCALTETSVSLALTHQMSVVSDPRTSTTAACDSVRSAPRARALRGRHVQRSGQLAHAAQRGVVLGGRRAQLRCERAALVGRPRARLLRRLRLGNIIL